MRATLCRQQTRESSDVCLRQKQIPYALQLHLPDRTRQIHESSDQLDRETRNAEMRIKELKLDNERLLARERERSAALEVWKGGKNLPAQT